MENYKIPQEVQVEDRIFGPITMRRLIILSIGGGITYLFFIKLQSFGVHFWVPPTLFFGGLTLAFAFFEPFGMRFGKFLTRFFAFVLLPKQRKWDKRFSHDALFAFYESQDGKWQKKQETGPKVVEDLMMMKQEKIQKLSELSPLLHLD